MSNLSSDQLKRFVCSAAESLSKDVELHHNLLRHTPLGKNCPSQSLEDISLR